MNRRPLIAALLGSCAAAALQPARAALINVVAKSVLSYGAQGDGVTNDDAARAAGEADALALYWPEGNYVVSQPPSLAVSWGPGKVFVGVRVYLRPSAEPAKAGLRRPRHLSGHTRQPLPDRLQLLALLHPGCAEPVRPDSIRIQRVELVGIVEYAAAVVVHEALGRRALGQQHVVSVELHVVVMDLVDAGPDDGGAIH